MGLAAPLSLLCVLTCAHAATRPQSAFVHRADLNPTALLRQQETQRARSIGISTSGVSSSGIGGTRSSRCSAAPRLGSSSPWLTQPRNHRNNGRAGVSMAAFWAEPPLPRVSVLQLPLLGSDDVAVVYFTACDLRTHDHDALVAAAGAAGVVPVYVFDDQVRQAFKCRTVAHLSTLMVRYPGTILLYLAFIEHSRVNRQCYK